VTLDSRSRPASGGHGRTPNLGAVVCLVAVTGLLLGALLAGATTTAAAATGSPRGTLDVARGGPGTVIVAGWAFDPDTPAPITVLVVLGGEGHPVTANGNRPNVGAAFPGAGDDHGFQLTLPAPDGTQNVCLWALNTGSGANILLGCPQVTVRSNSPIGTLDVVTDGPSRLTVAGWAFDPDTPAPIAVHIYVDSDGTALTADGSRPDVGAAFPGAGDNHGFAATIPAKAGTHQVCAYGINVASGGNRLIGCRSALVIPPFDGNPSGPKVAVLGNSLISLSAEEIPAALNDTYLTSSAGENGMTIEQILPLADRYAAHRPTIAVIEAGVNDAGRPDSQWNALYELAMESQMLQRFPRASCIVWVNVGTHTTSPELNAHAAELNAGMRFWKAGEPRLLIADWDSITVAHPEYLFPDGVHPNQEGQDHLAALIRTSADACAARTGGTIP
jgi:hypothetical protein